MAVQASVKLVLPSQVRLIDVVHSAAERMAEVAGFDESEALNVGLAVREAAINAILHGNGQDPKLKVEVTLKVDAKGLEARVRDHGAGFDPGTTPDPREAGNLLQTSGRGLLLIRAFVDDVEFRRKRTGGMEITLTKRVRPAADGDS